MKYLIVGSLIAFGILINSRSNAQNHEWKYQVPIAIMENSASSLSNYQVLITIDTQTPISSGKMNTDGSDIRFIQDCTDSIFLDYYIQSYLNTDSTVIWVRVPSIPASDSTTIYMLYGNSSAIATSNVDSTFDLYDDFNNTITAFSYECNTDSTTFSGSSVTLNWIGSGVYTSNSTFPVSVAFKAEAKVDTCIGRWPGIFWKLAGNGTGYSLLSDGTVPDMWIGKTATAGYCASENWASSVIPYTNPTGIWEHTWVATGDIVSNFPSVGQITSSDVQYSKSSDLKLGIGGIQGGIGSITLDWIRVRKYASIEPSYLIGTEEGPITASFNYTKSGLAYIFSDNSINVIEYLWDFGDGKTDSIANPSHTYDSIGSYTVCLTVINNCLADSVCKQITVVNSSIHEEMKQHNITVYPNPFKDQATLLFSYNPHSFKQLSLLIFDVFGREMRRIENFEINYLLIRRDNLPAGMYFIKLIHESQVLSIGRFIVQ
ncbi:MAG: DUF2341 domain-containing protein [Bacteroidetes bacterium]|nr:DUF2341 domain-containing protein [Bacteroidota bacterium]